MKQNPTLVVFAHQHNIPVQHGDVEVERTPLLQTDLSLQPLKPPLGTATHVHTCICGENIMQQTILQ